MILYPEYSENIIVYVIIDNVGNWYVTEKEIWFLNRAKFSSAFGVNPSEDDITFIQSIANGDPTMLLREISEYCVNTNELKELINIYPPLSKNEDVLEMRPSLLVDFSQKRLINLFPEPSGEFHNYSPDGWHSSYDDFWGLIPEHQNYWIIENKNVFN